MTSTPPSTPEQHAGHGSGIELWLVRHAEVHGDWQGRAYGDLDVPLSAEGEARTRELAPLLAQLEPDIVLTSPLERARVLGERVANAADVPLRIQPELREVHRGSWQGRTVADLHEASGDEVRAFYADPWNWCGHGGESDRVLAGRAWSALDPLLAAAHASGERPRRIVVTTHYNVIRVLLAGALGVPSASTFALRIDTGRCALIADRPDGWHLIRTNVMDPTIEREGVR